MICVSEQPAQSKFNLLLYNLLPATYRRLMERSRLRCTTYECKILTAVGFYHWRSDIYCVYFVISPVDRNPEYTGSSKWMTKHSSFN